MKKLVYVLGPPTVFHSDRGPQRERRIVGTFEGSTDKEIVEKAIADHKGSKDPGDFEIAKEG